MKMVKQKLTEENKRNFVCNCPFASQSAMFGGGWWLVNKS